MPDWYKRPVRGLLMALGLYTALPVGQRWDDGCRELLAPSLPAVGLVLGLLWVAVAALLTRFAPRFLSAAGIALALPVMTGFLHLDGFMDVMDAMLSARPREEKLRILKDPHAGAFAVIALCCLLLLQVAACGGALERDRNLRVLLFLPVVSRAAAGLAVMTVPPMAQSAYGRMNFDGATSGKRLFCALCALGAVVLALSLDRRGGVACAACAAGFAAALAWGVRGLGGMNGDIAGCAICVAEACGLIALACL